MKVSYCLVNMSLFDKVLLFFAEVVLKIDLHLAAMTASRALSPLSHTAVDLYNLSIKLNVLWN